MCNQRLWQTVDDVEIESNIDSECIEVKLKLVLVTASAICRCFAVEFTRLWRSG